MQYSKPNYETGNFVYYSNQLHLIFKQDDTLIGPLLYLISCDSQSNLHIIPENKVQSYNQKPNNQPPASNMSQKQQNYIKRIESVLQIKFNGKTLTDVSTFIGQFLPASQHKRYSDNELEQIFYDGLDFTDLMQ